MSNKNYELIQFDRNDEEIRAFIKELSLTAYDDRYTVKNFPHDRASYGIFSEKHFDADLSRIIITDGRKVGSIIITHAPGCDAWELGFFHILPEFQKNGIGSAVLAEVEGFVKESDWSTITTKFHSPRSLVNGIPAFRGDVLAFFTKRGYHIKEHVAGAFINTPEQFCCDKEKLCRKIDNNRQCGYKSRDVTLNDSDYEQILAKAADLCMREEHEGWEKFFSESYAASERTGISVIEYDNEVVAVAAYSFAVSSPTIWGDTPQWGPLLTDHRHRGRGLASWIIYNSLQKQFANGVLETILWTGVGSGPAKIYENFGFRLLCPWFGIEK